MTDKDRDEQIRLAHEPVTMPRYKLARIERKLAKVRSKRDEARAALRHSMSKEAIERMGTAGYLVRHLGIQISNLQREVSILRAEVDAATKGDVR